MDTKAVDKTTMETLNKLQRKTPNFGEGINTKLTINPTNSNLAIADNLDANGSLIWFPPTLRFRPNILIVTGLGTKPKILSLSLVLDIGLHKSHSLANTMF